MSKRYVPSRPAAKIINTSESFLSKARVYGGGPLFIKCGSKVLYDIDDLHKWMAERKRSSTSDQGQPVAADAGA